MGLTGRAGKGAGKRAGQRLEVGRQPPASIGRSVGAGQPTLSGLPVEQLRAFLEASCAAQGLPVAVTDPRVLRDVVALLTVPRADDAA